MEEDIVKEFLDAMVGARKSTKVPHFFDELSYSELAVFRAMTFLSHTCPDTEVIKMSEICAHLKISKPALSQIINKLEDKNLVERVVQKSDRRSTFIRFTEKGAGIFERQNLQMHVAIEQVIEKMGHEEAKRFIVLMKKFHDVVGQMDFRDIQEKAEALHTQKEQTLYEEKEKTGI